MTMMTHLFLRKRKNCCLQTAQNVHPIRRNNHSCRRKSARRSILFLSRSYYIISAFGE